uniref:Small-subunit processome Utp12 domain-containing protein n=1 Tax=Calcidiscus leptoporus TaxID=127549 RepID=A0A7S0P2Q4_9EUKA|mmetsp:Transcript_48070/g.111335  ORF Transcript_48070/g.111335 Transcript_48070/m.111335 type:complete len:974 (+) Transcript_48070:94-3015(+)
MVKAYLRYAEDAAWGVIVSSSGSILATHSGDAFISPALDAVHVRSLKTGALTATLRPEAAAGPTTAVPAEVTALELAPDGDTLAVGDADGSVRLWSLFVAAERVRLTGHRGGVRSLRFSGDGALLASGGNDTSVVLWDVVGEAGVCKLRGHRAAVTDLLLLDGGQSLASVSKDGVLKLWDVPSQHCVQTATAPSGELYTIDAHEARGRLLTGGAGGELLLWSLEHKQLIEAKATNGAMVTEKGASASAGVPAWVAPHVTLLGSFETPSGAHVVRVRFDSKQAFAAVQFADKNLLVLGVQDAGQLKRQQKRKLAKKRKHAEADDDAAGDDDADAEVSPLAAFQALASLRGAHKLHSFAFLPASTRVPAERQLIKGEARAAGKRPASLRLLVAQRNNLVGVWDCELKPRGACALVSSVGSMGHRQEPRCVALSSDERSVLTVADGEAKVWSVSSQQCLRSFACGYGLCATFVLSGRFVVVGNKAGTLQLFSMATGELVHEVGAHSAAVYGLALEPGAQGVLSASADKRLATWLPEAREDGTACLREDRVHELPDDALCCAYSADGKFVAAGLLDASVKVLFTDTFKLFLTLYGHKLPVLSLSVSSDGALLVSGSADKAVKIWGLDFGDCHRSLYAHGESVTCVQFVRGTHYFFSCGKDKLIKYWDADSFEQIHTLRAHTAEVWSLVISRKGDFVVSVGRDRAVRLWRRSEEQVFIEEEREAELEAAFEGGLERQQQTAEAEEEEAAALGLEGGAAEGTHAGRRTLESVKGAERVLEALRVLDDEDERRAEHALALQRWEEASARTSDAKSLSKQPVLVPNLLLLGLSPGDYLLKALSGVRTAELDQALMLLPFDAVRRLLTRLLPLVDSAPPIELMARCVLFLLRVHYKQVLANHSLLQLLHPLESKLRTRVTRERDMLGFNMAALGFLKQSIETSGSGRAFFDEQLRERASRQASSTAELRRQTASRQRGSRKR